jgi:hypothetical protein
MSPFWRCRPLRIAPMRAAPPRISIINRRAIKQASLHRAPTAARPINGSRLYRVAAHANQTSQRRERRTTVCDTSNVIHRIRPDSLAPALARQAPWIGLKFGLPQRAPRAGGIGHLDMGGLWQMRPMGRFRNSLVAARAVVVPPSGGASTTVGGMGECVARLGGRWWKAGGRVGGSHAAAAISAAVATATSRERCRDGGPSVSILIRLASNNRCIAAASFLFV